MIPDSDLTERGLLIVTGSSLRAEQADRPLAYKLKDTIENQLCNHGDRHRVVVLSDLWYLNAELLQQIPTISVGGPSVNALSAHLLRRLPSVLAIDNTLIIQMDLQLRDLRATVWGDHLELTADAIDIFVHRGYLERFIEAVVTRHC